MTGAVVTVYELRALRGHRNELSLVTAGLHRLGHAVPAEVAGELEQLNQTSVDVVIRCLLCGAFGTSPATLDGDATPHAAICTDCDRRTWPAADAP